MVGDAVRGSRRVLAWSGGVKGGMRRSGLRPGHAGDGSPDTVRPGGGPDRL